MSDNELLCNIDQCRKVLTSTAWVTFCSHIFCDEDGSHRFITMPCSCPACGTPISKSTEVFRIDLEPSENFKNMEKERAYQLQAVEALKCGLRKQEEQTGKVYEHAKGEVLALTRQLQACEKEKDSLREQKECFAAKLAEKNRQHQQLKSLYDKLYRRHLPYSQCRKSPEIGESSRFLELPQIPPAPIDQRMSDAIDPRFMIYQSSPGLVRPIHMGQVNVSNNIDEWTFSPVSSQKKD